MSEEIAISTTSTPLTLDSLNSLPASIQSPCYLRSSLSAGILHFGVGNFHRAHQAIYLDSLMNDGRDYDWAIVGASVVPGDAHVRNLLLKQDWLGSVTACSRDGVECRVTGVMIDYLPVNNSVAILEALEDLDIRIVSLTITEEGYFVDSDSGLFDEQHLAIQSDVQNFDSPSTVFGLIARALKTRRDNGQQPFTVLSCDNISHNGEVTRRAVVGMASLVDPGLAEWIDAHSRFPSGMVDRIAPTTGRREQQLLAETYQIADAAPVFCENYLQWVLEDDFVDGRPQLDAVGVKFVKDVTPFETMRIRILNGGFTLIAYPAALLDIQGSQEAMSHPLVRGFLDKVELEEILPTVTPVPDTDLHDYYQNVVRRFANPHIVDSVRTLFLEGSNWQPRFIIPSIIDRLNEGGSVEGLALASALWCRYCFGKTESGATISPDGPSWDFLQARATDARSDPKAWLAMHDVYGDLACRKKFSRPFEQYLSALWDDGTEKVLRRFTDA